MINVFAWVINKQWFIVDCQRCLYFMSTQYFECKCFNFNLYSWLFVLICRCEQMLFSLSCSCGIFSSFVRMKNALNISDWIDIKCTTTYAPNVCNGTNNTNCLTANGKSSWLMDPFELSKYVTCKTRNMLLCWWWCSCVGDDASEIVVLLL